MKEKRPILKNRFYLYLTEFFSGMSVMAVELGASRLMAPYFSSSQIVWTYYYCGYLDRAHTGAWKVYHPWYLCTFNLRSQ